MSDRTGQQIGNYRLVRLLGAGAFAEVYLGQHIHLNTPAAIKLLHALLTAQDSERFRLEAQTIARLIHPHIVRVLDFGIENRVPFLVMDYAPNGTIRHRYPLGSRLPLALIVTYVQQIASALQYAHTQKLVHRDVKPDNLLIGRSEELLLGDFGIALTVQGTMTQNVQDVAGTIAYMAPEVFDGRARPASDQYALGIIVYEWLCGNRPFEGTFVEMGFKHSSVPPPPLRKKIPDIAASIEQVIMTALAKDPAQRYPHVMDFATAFSQACAPFVRTTQPGGTTGQQFFSPQLPLSGTNTPLLLQSTTTMQTPTRIATSTSPPTAIERHTEKKQTLSRRVLVGSGIALVGATGIGGSLAWYLANAHGGQSPVSGEAGATILVYTGHTLPVYTVAWSPDGHSIASGGQDKTVQVWDASSGQKRLAYDQQGASENCVAWSPSGYYIASGSSSRTVDVWDAKAGRQITSYAGHSDTLRTVAWSHTGALVASGSDDKTVQVWEALTAKPMLTYTGHTDAVWSLAWSPDDQSIASASVDKTVRIWDIASRQTTHIYREHTSQVKAIAWSHNGHYIASVSDDLTVRVWNVPSLETLFVYKGHRDDLNAIAWSYDDKYVASGSGDYTAHILDAMTGSLLLKYTGHTLAVHSLA